MPQKKKLLRQVTHFLLTLKLHKQWCILAGRGSGISARGSGRAGITWRAAIIYFRVSECLRNAIRRDQRETDFVCFTLYELLKTTDLDAMRPPSLYRGLYFSKKKKNAELINFLSVWFYILDPLNY